MKYQIFFCLVLLSACIDEVRLEIGSNTEEILDLDQSIRTKQDHQTNSWLLDARLSQEMNVVIQDHGLIDQTATSVDQNTQILDQNIVIADQMIQIADQAVTMIDQAIVIVDQSVDMNQPRQILNCPFDWDACQSLRINEINNLNSIGESRFIEVYHPTNYELSQNNLQVEIQEIMINLSTLERDWRQSNSVSCIMSSQEFYICDIALLNSFDHLEFNSRDFGNFGDFESGMNNTHKILNIRLKYQGFLIENLWHMDETFFDNFNRFSGNFIQELQTQNRIIPKLDNQESSLSRCDQTDNAFTRLTVSFGQANPCEN